MKSEVNEAKTNKLNIFKDTYGKNLTIMIIVLFSVEIIFRIMNNFAIFDYATLRIFLSTVIFSLIITFISSLTKRRWLKNTINLLFIFVYSLYTWLQQGFINYLGVYISFHTSSQFGAVKDYIFDYLNSFRWTYYLIFVPFIIAIIIYIVLGIKGEYQKLKFNKKTWLLLPGLVVTTILYYASIVLPFMQNEFQIKSNQKLFKNPDVPTVAVNQFGTTVFGILDLKSYLFQVEEEETTFNPTLPNNHNIDASRKVSESLSKIAEEDTNSKYSSLNK